MRSLLILMFKLLKLVFSINPVVRIKNGEIMGRTGLTSNTQTLYHAFQGIPYAQPPVDHLRFKPPLPVEDWNGTLMAQEDKNICVQPTRNISELLGHDVQEDCLYLNVYTPSLNEPSTLLPVLVWVYGGGFMKGSSRYEQYAPDYLLEEGLVFVSFNYRVGIFGFYSTEDEILPGNAGLKDQILALKWVQENIRTFGGDPNNVTLYGQSAGAASVSYLQQSPLTEGLFHRVIISSGSTLHTWALARNKRETMFQTGQMLGIVTNSSEELLLAMQNVPAVSLFTISVMNDLTTMAATNPFYGLLVSPSIEPDLPGAVVTNKSYSQLEEGYFNRVPTLVGFNSMEGLLFYDDRVLAKMYISTFALNLFKFCPISMHINDTSLMENVGQQIADKYELNYPLLVNDTPIFQYISDDQFVRPTVKVAELQAQNAPVYLYEFSYEGDTYNYHGIPGSAHADELIYIFATRHLTSKRDLLTRDRMVKLWSNFAKTSNPTPNDELINWPTFSNETRYYLDIGDELIVKQNPAKDTVLYWNTMFEIYGNPPYDTY